MDMANSNADDFLSKIRSKYSFLAGGEAPKKHADITQTLGIDSSKGTVLDKMSYSGIQHMNPPNPYAPDSLSNGPSRRSSSVADGRSSIHFDKHIGGYTAFPSRSQLPSLASTHHLPVRVAAGGTRVDLKPQPSGEFKSRFLDKVRERKASEHTSSNTSQLTERVMAKIHKDQPASETPLPVEA